MAAKPYNGHPSWAAWNVALWIGNDEGLYHLALECNRVHSNVQAAARMFTRNVGAERTPDGARYSLRSVSLALSGLKE